MTMYNYLVSKLFIYMHKDIFGYNHRYGQMLNFSAKDETIESVLFSTKRYRVPKYQRPYSWGQGEAADFVSDIQGDTSIYFLGALIFNNESLKKENVIEITDGQQRLLTITLFMAAIRDIFKELGEKYHAELVQRQNISIEDNRGKLTNRIICGDNTQKFVELFQRTDTDINKIVPVTKEQKLIIGNYKFFKGRITDELKLYPDKDKKIETLLNLRQKVYDLKVINITIENEDDAYEVFETVNARGVELSVSDLLKNLIFKRIKKEWEGDMNPTSLWNTIISNVEDTETDLKKFLRYYWLSKHAFVTEKKLFKEIKKNTADYKQLLQNLVNASDYYRMLLDPDIDDWKDFKDGDKIVRILENLEIMKVSQCYVLFMSILRNSKKINTNTKRIFELVEKFTFQYSVVSKLQANQVEKIYSKFAIQIENAVKDETPKKIAGKIQSILSELESSLKKIRPTRQQFTEGFSDIEYGRSENSRKLVKYVLSKFNYQDSSGENRIDFTNVNIEHILPQKPGKAWGLKRSDVKAYVDKIGNLVLVSKRYNSVMGNTSIAEKTKMLEKSEIKATNTLAKEIIAEGNKWGEKEILGRHSLMANEAYDKVFAI